MTKKEDVAEEFVTNVDKLFNKDSLIGSRRHAIWGIWGEVGELVDALKQHFVYGKETDRENLIEEVGDLLFYMVALMNNKEASIRLLSPCNSLPPKSKVRGENIHLMLHELQKNFALALSLTKVGSLVRALRANVLILNTIMLMFRCGNLNSALRYNMSKLNVRYPEKRFTKEHAVKRADKSEEAKKHAYKKLTAKAKLDIITRFNSGENKEDIASFYGVTVTTVSYIVSGLIPIVRRKNGKVTAALVKQVYRLNATLSRPALVRKLKLSTTTINLILKGDYDNLDDKA